MRCYSIVLRRICLSFRSHCISLVRLHSIPTRCVAKVAMASPFLKPGEQRMVASTEQTVGELVDMLETWMAAEGCRDICRLLEPFKKCSFKTSPTLDGLLVSLRLVDAVVNSSHCKNTMVNDLKLRKAFKICHAKTACLFVTRPIDSETPVLSGQLRTALNKWKMMKTIDSHYRVVMSQAIYEKHVRDLVVHFARKPKVNLKF